MPRFSRLLAAFAILASGPAFADQIPASLLGRYAPHGDCTRLPVLTVSATGIHIEMSDDRHGTITPVTICLTCATGPAASTAASPEIWVLPQMAGGTPPFLFRFNAGGQKGRLEVDKNDPMLPSFVAALVYNSPYAPCGK
jgi:hypothetical protein